MKKVNAARLVLLAVVVAILALSVGCGRAKAPAEEKPVFRVDNNMFSLNVGESASVNCTSTREGAVLDWTASHPDIVSVAANGSQAVLTAEAEGTGYVTVTDGVRCITMKIVVAPAGES